MATERVDTLPGLAVPHLGSRDNSVSLINGDKASYYKVWWMRSQSANESDAEPTHRCSVYNELTFRRFPRSLCLHLHYLNCLAAAVVSVFRPSLPPSPCTHPPAALRITHLIIRAPSFGSRLTVSEHKDPFM